MKTQVLIIFSILVTLNACNYSHPLAEEIDRIETKSYTDQFGKLADSSFNDSSDINLLIHTKMIDLSGTITPLGFNEAIDLYKKNRKASIRQSYPIFEITNQSKVILPLFGRGLWDQIWGYAVIDKKNMSIIHIELDHAGETPGSGALITDSTFRSQFLGRFIDVKPTPFALYQEQKEVIAGAQKIDGISGATVTSKGVIKMLNVNLALYGNYFKQEEANWHSN